MAATLHVGLLSVLEGLESGDVGAAKQELSRYIGHFYRNQKQGLRNLASCGIFLNEQDPIGRALRSIERDAERFECLRVALANVEGEPRG
ncbi:MAG: hypothetical protein HZA90_10160 [Verrucomicrobia bacterium]|nr:hypothetical protein [Verrucomicrobiota bacterium]